MGFTAVEWAVGTIMVVLATASIISSSMTISIIRSIGTMNGYLILVLSMAVGELFYDISFYFIICYKYEVCQRITSFLSYLGGCSVSLWSNVLSFVVVFVVIKYRSFPILKYYSMICLVVVGLSLIPAIIWQIFRNEPQAEYCDWSYYIWRLVSIGINVISYCIITLRIRRLVRSSTKNANMEGFDSPLRTLVRRFKYYPICQALIRSGATWYELKYGFNSDTYSNQSSPTEVTSLLFFAVCSSCSGLANFIVFLMMQPQAYNEFKVKFLGPNSCLGYICSCMVSKTDEESDTRILVRNHSTALSESLSPSTTVDTEFNRSLAFSNDCNFDKLNEDELEIALSVRYNHSRQLSSA